MATMRRKNITKVFLIIFLFSFAITISESPLFAWSGKILDKETGSPLERTVIIRSWDRELATPAGTVNSFVAFEENLSDKNGKFSISIIKRILHVGVPFFAPIIENDPIIYKPGYKFLVLEDKIPIIHLEKIPTILNLREVEVKKARGNYEIDFYKTNIFKGIIEKEEEFIQFKRFVKRRRLYENKRKIVQQRIKTKRENRKIMLGKLRKYNYPRKAEYLINALEDEDFNVRKKAAKSLEKIEINDSSQMEALKIIVETQIEGWNDKNKSVKKIPIVYLGRIGTPVIEPLIKALKHENRDVRWRAAVALARTQDYRSIEPMIAALEDKDLYVRQKVVWSLRLSNDPEVIKHLISILNDEDESLKVRRSAAGSLGEIGDHSAIKPLINALKREPKHAYSYTQALMNIGNSAVEDLIGLLNDDNWRVRKEAATILTYAKNDRVLDALIKASNDENSKVLTNITFALGEFRNSRAVDPLITLLKNEDPEVRWRAVEALGKIQNQRAIEPLIDALKDHSSRVRESTIEALGMMKKDKKVIEALIGAWKDSDIDVRKITAEVLVDIGSQAVEPLIKLLKHDDSYLRWRAAWALGKIRDPKAVEYLTPLLQDEVSEVRFIATEALRYFKM